ncbi:hypothetical protein A2U01_0095710, partial [Trifolium medium]|nr:hypothetical protein [Trifolium medium]
MLQQQIQQHSTATVQQQWQSPRAGGGNAMLMQVSLKFQVPHIGV